MDVLSNLALGFGVALTLKNLTYCFLGVFLGTLIGVLPGIGPLVTIAMLLPITFGLDPVSSLIMLAGIFYGAQYGGSTTAILVNMPGRGVLGGDGHRRLPDGAAGPGRAGARHRGDGLVRGAASSRPCWSPSSARSSASGRSRSAPPSTSR